MALFLLLEEVLADELTERQRQRRGIRERFVHRAPPDREFSNTFRLTPEVFETLCAEVVPLLPPKRNSRGIDPSIKILTALKFYGRGDYQGGVGRDDWVPMSQQAVSQCLREVTQALNTDAIVRRHVRFPQNQRERAVIKTGFFNNFHIPGICGAIDCTHIAIIRPAINEERFFNRKHYHSLNVQMICDDVNQILNVDASYGGATHDSFIWQNGELREHFENLCGMRERASLLGDSGYPLREYMMTPVDGAADDSPEGRYNILQKRARSIIERTFGILKGRWRCMLAARELHYSPEMAGRLVVACSVLHNMCVSARLEPMELTEEEAAEERRLQPDAGAAPAAPPARARAAAAGAEPADALQRGRDARATLIRELTRR